MNERELEREEKKLELEIKKAAKMGNKQVSNGDMGRDGEG